MILSPEIANQQVRYDAELNNRKINPNPVDVEAIYGIFQNTSPEVPKEEYKSSTPDQIGYMIIQNRFRTLLTKSKLYPPFEGEEIGNGFVFTIDRRPEDDFRSEIPAIPYTAYFSRGEVPIPPEGHGQRWHDDLHAINFREILKSPAFAGLVIEAAKSANGNLGKSKIFAGTMDTFVNYILFMDIGMQTPGYLVRLSLDRLIQLLPEDVPADRRKQIGDDVWSELRLAERSTGPDSIKELIDQALGKLSRQQEEYQEDKFFPKYIKQVTVEPIYKFYKSKISENENSIDEYYRQVQISA